ncbi:MAG: hypothetical protein JKY37_27015 [Nannocystaceae bacterium]|nr:hypothetical protein [Nannocystaceae bacterium]
MTTFVRIDGTTYAVVPDRDVAPLPYDLHDARALIHDIVGDDTARLHAYLDDNMELGFFPDRADPVAVAAELLLHGHIMFVRLEQAFQALDAPTIHDLVDPSRADPLAPTPADRPTDDPKPGNPPGQGPVAPGPEGPAPTDPAPAVFVPPASIDPDAKTPTVFEVVDRRGRAILGAFTCVLEGRSESGELSHKTHRYLSVAQRGLADLDLKELRPAP